MIQRRTKQRGFTLVEMMVALILGSVAAIALTLITRSMAQTAENEQMVVEASQAARAGIDMLRFDFMRAGMFYAANPRADKNANSLVTGQGSGAGTHRAYFRNPIVHLNPNAPGPDTIILVGNFIGDTLYEGEVIAELNTITIRTPFAQGMCEKEFNGNYAFAHLVNATGQTHEAKVSSAIVPIEQGCSSGTCDSCVLSMENGELIGNAFGERNAKIAANQAVMYRLETISGDRNVLMRYYIDYDSTTAPSIALDSASAITTYAAGTAVVVAENVVDFQVWFRAVNPASTGRATGRPMADQAYYPSLAGSTVSTLPDPEDVIVNDTNTNPHLPMPASSNINSNVVFPEHVRSAIISLAVRTEKTDQMQGRDADTETDGAVVADELANAPTGDVGKYKVRRFTVEVKLPNIQSQMALFQAPTTLTY